MTTTLSDSKQRTNKSNHNINILAVFTEWRHCVSQNFCETQLRHSMKTRLYKNPPPYFIVLASSVKTKEVEVIDFHRIQCLHIIKNNT